MRDIKHEHVSLTIDGLAVRCLRAPPFFDAAGQGIPIPTLCHQQNETPAASAAFVSSKPAAAFSRGCIRPREQNERGHQLPKVQSVRRTLVELLMGIIRRPAPVKSIRVTASSKLWRRRTASAAALPKRLAAGQDEPASPSRSITKPASLDRVSAAATKSATTSSGRKAKVSSPASLSISTPDGQLELRSCGECMVSCQRRAHQ